MGQYGYLSDEWANAFRRFGLIDVVWVTGDCKLKNLDPDSTYILFKDGPLSYRSISTNNDIRPIVTFNLFYIYYRPMKGVYAARRTAAARGLDRSLPHLEPHSAGH